MSIPNQFEDLLRGYGGLPDKNNGYHCNKCKYEMTMIEKGRSFDFQKMFYCTNNKCDKYGLVTVVAIKKSK